MVQRVEEEKDRGATVDSSLEFCTPISNRIKKKHTSMLAIIRRTFQNSINKYFYHYINLG